MSCHVVTFATIVFSKCQCHVVTFASDVGTYDIDICDKSRNICAYANSHLTQHVSLLEAVCWTGGAALERLGGRSRTIDASGRGVETRESSR